VNEKKYEGSRRISVEIRNNYVEKLDLLKREWGLRARGDVLIRLLDDIFSDNSLDNVQLEIQEQEKEDTKSSIVKNDHFTTPIANQYNETKALILISDETDNVSSNVNFIHKELPKENKAKSLINQNKIDLPRFVRNRTQEIKDSLNPKSIDNFQFDTLIKPVNHAILQKSHEKVRRHWNNLYGQEPTSQVIDSAMIWLARDIWPNIDGNFGISFTWNSANKLMGEYCPDWDQEKPTFDRIIVLAGVLEDPFAIESLTERIPTLIRRFVNKFKRSQNVTSFQTIESTMTVHGALKLLGLPTHAGASLTLLSIRESYKAKALTIHPDTGGSTDAMRKLNEAYQLLKELYRKR
tara:strand:+ start:2926 stop:3978 length:1053 start_codon:yes stop_codon:yes gene_type:complete